MACVTESFEESTMKITVYEGQYIDDDYNSDSQVCVTQIAFVCSFKKRRIQGLLSFVTHENTMLRSKRAHIVFLAFALLLIDNCSAYCKQGVVSRTNGYGAPLFAGFGPVAPKVSQTSSENAE